eukprot:Hpha_TRINITY_DN16104_c0_g1::TRINITY_DN16104_c0_g1_i1::g.6654::m.6654
MGNGAFRRSSSSTVTPTTEVFTPTKPQTVDATSDETQERFEMWIGGTPISHVNQMQTMWVGSNATSTRRNTPNDDGFLDIEGTPGSSLCPPMLPSSQARARRSCASQATRAVDRWRVDRTRVMSMVNDSGIFGNFEASVMTSFASDTSAEDEKEWSMESAKECVM